MRVSKLASQSETVCRPTALDAGSDPAGIPAKLCTANVASAAALL